MKKVYKRVSEYWDKQILKFIPPYARFDKVNSEIHEHLGLVAMMFERIIVPLMIFFIILGLILNVNIMGSLILSLIAFLYSNFIPDSDFLIRQTKNSYKQSLWYEKYFILFFAPIVVYYVLIGKAKPIYDRDHRCFHNVKSLIIYTVFLFLIANILWDQNIKMLMFTILGSLGFAFHLAIDRGFAVLFVKKHNKKKSSIK